MKLILCARLTNWPVNRLLRKRKPATAGPPSPEASTSERLPLVVLHTAANRQIIVACCDRAAAMGIRADMTLAQARALCSSLDIAPFRLDLDAKALEALARYLLRFTPSVALSTRDATEIDESPATESILYLDLSGCDHLYGGLTPMVRKIADAFHRLRIPATLALAHTPGAAYALTHKPAISNLKSQISNSTGVHSLIASTPETFYAALPQLPLCALRLPEEVLQSLHHLGLDNIAQLQQIPRDTLPARFGRQVLQRLDQLTGKLPEPLICLTCPCSLETMFDFDGSVADPLALEQVFQDLLAKLLLQLERRGEGIRELQIALKTYESPFASDPKPQMMPLTLSVSRPSRDARMLLNLYRCAFDQLTQAATMPSRKRHSRQSTINHQQPYSRNYDSGFTAMILRIVHSQPLPHRQLTVDQQDHSQQENAWQNTLDLIRTRLGESAIAQAELHPSYLPEKAFRRLSAGISENPPADAAPELSHRPLHLFSAPAELHVLVTPSHDADGAPASFGIQGDVHTVTHAAGPERVAGEWWEGHHRTRDYFDIADETGRHYWVFKVQETGKWYLHGTFE